MIRFRLKSADGTILAEKLVKDFPVSLGRATGNGVSVGDAGVSSRHAEIDWDGNHLHLRDLSSRNGTFVNGESVTEMVLNLPCVFRLGSDVMVEAEEARAQEISNGLPHRAPTVFRPTLPQAAMAREMKPVLADVVVTAEPVMGEERYWHRLRSVTPREASAVALALTAAMFVTHFLVFRESFLESFVVAATELVACLVMGAITAALLALPGALLRGEYSFKPLFLQLVGASMLGCLLFTFRAGFLFDYLGIVFRVLSLPVALLICVSGPYTFLFSTVPHRHARRLFVASAVFAFLAFSSQGYSIFSFSHKALVRSAFLGDFHASRGLAGAQTNVKAVTDDLRAFGAERPLTR